VATGRPLILVVDDDEIMRDAMVAVLESAGYAVIGERTATEALAHLQSGAVKPSLILLDLKMPGMSGVEFRATQLQDEALKAIPVVFVSAFPNTVDVLQSGGRLHAAGVLRKPVDARKLLAMVRRLCPPREPSSA
jgi:CheY-like chemotaxis protein